jgi:RNA polymerase sigma-70 factor (ECF subfamily)
VNELLEGLVARCQQGDKGAFARLVRETQGNVYNLAFGILHDHEEAQDMVQETYVRVWRALPGFRGDARFSTWLYRITVNACLNRKRQLRAQLHVVDSEETLQSLGNGEPDPLSATLSEETRRTIWSAVDRLADKYRLVIVLFYQEQLSYQQIAEMLSLPLGTVKAHLNRAREALARRLRLADYRPEQE